MSEIKGTLLGVILTIAVFGAIFTTMKLVFDNTADAISEEVAGEVTSAFGNE